MICIISPSCLCVNLSNVFYCAAYEVGGAPEQPASEHVRRCYTESNFAAHGAGHLQQTHPELRLRPPLLLHQKTGPIGNGKPVPGMFSSFLMYSY